MNATDASTPPTAHPLLVALAAWAVPGLGYWLLGDRKRGVVIGVAISLLFVGGLLIGGARALEVPMIDRSRTHRLLPGGDRNISIPDKPLLMDEIRAKPWSIAQVMTGPLAFCGAYLSFWAGPKDGSIESAGVESHARVNEIAVLYTAVAGMLNLLAIIDSAHRAGRILEERAS